MLWHEKSIAERLGVVTVTVDVVRRGIGTIVAVIFLGGCRAQPADENLASPLTLEQGTKLPSTQGPVAAPTAPSSETSSDFTSIDPQQCQLLEENVEEGGWSRRLCAGAADYKLELTDSDLRQDVIVISANGQRAELGLTEIVANGAFNALGKTAEWRGADPSSPEVLIVRLSVAADPTGLKPELSNLIVARLKRSVCIVAVVPPGTAQNERARAIADGKLPECLRP